MEQFDNRIEDKGEEIIKDLELYSGKNIAIKKVISQNESEIKEGRKISGKLMKDVKIGSPIYIKKNDSIGAKISNIKKIFSNNNRFYIQTQTSVYEILNFDEEQNGKVEKIDWTDIEKVTTAKGSSYKYLDDGRTQRFKKVEGKQYEPQDILVFIPSYEWIIKNNPKGALEKIMGEGIDNKIKFEQEILSYIQGSKKGFMLYMEKEKN